MVSQIPSYSLCVAAPQVESQERIGECPTGEVGIGGSSLIEGVDQPSKIEILNLVVREGIAASRRKVDGGFFNHLQVQHALVVSRRIPTLQYNVLATACVQDQVVAGLVEREVRVANAAAQGKCVVLTIADFHGIHAITTVKGNYVVSSTCINGVITRTANVEIISIRTGERVCSRSASKQIIA